jgi:hypothetical protein
MNFRPGTSYPIDTLPDDLLDDAVPTHDKWAIRDALFWNDCEGWWHESISQYWLGCRYSGHVARFWQPEPVSPMTREAILAERGLVVCPDCDVAIDPNKAHCCKGRRATTPQRSSPPPNLHCFKL